MNKLLTVWMTVLVFLLISLSGRGQEKDTLSAMRTFLRLCHVYKQLPLQMEVDLRNSTNLVTAQEDTMSCRVKFVLSQDGSYIGFGELEQIVDDSVMLLISNKLKRMMVYPNHRSVSDQLKKYLGIQFKDSSLLQIAAKYTASLSMEKDTAWVEIRSRRMVYHTSLPGESIRVRYNPADSIPIGIVQLKRSLMPISQSTYEGMSGRADYEGKLIAGPDNRFFVIKEQVSTFSYVEIAHRPGVKLPAAISDRIVADAQGKYTPVKAYHDFLLTQNF